MIQVVVLDTKDNSITCRQIKNDLKTYHEIIGCDCIDIPVRKVGGVYYDIICDDEGLLKDDNMVSGIEYKTLQPMLVGTLIFCKHDDEGNTIGITNEDVKNIKSNTMNLIDLKHGTFPIVVKMEY